MGDEAHNQPVCVRLLLQKPREASVQNPAMARTITMLRKALTKLSAKAVA